jgi:hypothetical protein
VSPPHADSGSRRWSSCPFVDVYASVAHTMRSLSLLLLLPTVQSWPTGFALRSSHITGSQLESLVLLTPLHSAFSDELDNVPVADEMMSENPCWQDIYDDDCSMSSVYSAHFVAGKWIKSMPCAAGIEVCFCNCFQIFRNCLRTCLHIFRVCRFIIWGLGL